MRLERNLLYSLIFLLPTQLALHFWPPSAFIFGIRVDYLSPAIYLTDILVFALLVLWFKNDRKSFNKKAAKEKKFLFAFLVLAVVNLIFTTAFYPSLYKWTKLLEFIFFAFYISVRVKISDRGSLKNVLFFSLIFFCFIGVLQVVLGRTLGGAFYLLGERSFTLSTPGIALFSFGGRETLRAYSTFPHPNSLAGFIGVSGLIILALGGIKRGVFNLIGTGIITTALFLTASLSALLTLPVLFAHKLFWVKERIYKKMLPTFFILIVGASLILSIFSQKVLASRINLTESSRERLNLANIAGKMINEKFLVGEGLNTFIINIPRLNEISFSTWTLQPVHNIFLLMASETGIFGLILLAFIFFKSLRGYRSGNKIYFSLAFLFVLIAGLFDHYSLTLQQNLLLSSLLFGLAQE